MPLISSIREGHTVFIYVCDYEGCRTYFDNSRWKCQWCSKVFCEEHASAILDDDDEDEDEDDTKIECPRCCFCVTNAPDSRVFTENDVLDWALKQLNTNMNEAIFEMRTQLQNEKESHQKKKQDNKKKRKTESPFDVLKSL